jgi:hypothetical protein
MYTPGRLILSYLMPFIGENALLNKKSRKSNNKMVDLTTKKTLFKMHAVFPTAFLKTKMVLY